MDPVWDCFLLRFSLCSFLKSWENFDKEFFCSSSLSLSSAAGPFWSGVSHDMRILSLYRGMEVNLSEITSVVILGGVSVVLEELHGIV
jgi:hypothetical protein